MLVAMTPLPASIGAGHLGATQRACLLGGLAECYGERAVCHLRDPFRCRLAVRAARRGWVGAGRRGGSPGSGIQSHSQTTPQAAVVMIPDRSMRLRINDYLDREQSPVVI